MADPAPFDLGLAEGPAEQHAFWITALDGVRLRAAIWPKGQKGTVVLCPGRTEFVEKYGRTARDFGDAGYAMAAIDWRGQGRADRVLDNTAFGHVSRFSDYQHDLAALMSLIRDDQKLPAPYFLIGHSMGGAIALRALINEIPVRAAAFSAPMWGIAMAPHTRLAAWTLSWIAEVTHQGHRPVPNSSEQTYLAITEFNGNNLTHDPGYYAYMKQQAESYPEMSIGSPTLHWLREALLETKALRNTKLPKVPTIVGIGAEEEIVDNPAIEAIVATWPSAQLITYPGARHELWMEQDATRIDLTRRAIALFESQL